jgi:hypothetical protein
MKFILLLIRSYYLYVPTYLIIILNIFFAIIISRVSF